MAKVMKHRARPAVRRLMAAVLSVIYLIIACGPLANVAMRSSEVAHAITGECAGDCSICGCSPKSMASHTCCCQRRQQQAQIDEKEVAAPDCCKKTPVSNRIFIASCGSPCGGGEAVAVSGGTCSEILPYYFTERSELFQTETRHPNHPARPHSRFTDPPEPPPRQA